jgi:hypothetical protein
MASKLVTPELRERAVALRLAGKSRREIKEAIGVSRNQTLDELLRGIPPPAWTTRPRAKDDLHEKARELRAQGRTYEEIATELGVSKSSVSLWVRDLPRQDRLSYEEFRRRNRDGLSKFWAEENARREARRQAVSARAAAQVGALSDREVLIAGAIAYWCEGTKNKPHRRNDDVVFINSDPGLIVFFLRFLAVAGIACERLTCRVSIHESADVAAAHRFWRGVTGLPECQFGKPTLKHHNPKTIRKNVGEDYHGCLTIRVRLSADLYRRIEGWALATMAAPGAEVVRRDGAGQVANLS